jgi:hypothetical protein
MATLETPLVLMAEAVIGGHSSGRHQAAVVGLSHANSTIELPMDLILGYPTLRQAGWLPSLPEPADHTASAGISGHIRNDAIFLHISSRSFISNLNM